MPKPKYDLTTTNKRGEKLEIKYTAPRESDQKIVMAMLEFVGFFKRKGEDIDA